MDELMKLAEHHHGLLTRDQARGLGLPGHRLDGEIRRKHFERVGRNVYRVVGSVPTWRQSLLCGVLLAGAGAAASRRSAATLFGEEGFGNPIEISRPRRKTRWTGSGTLFESTFLPAHHIRTIDQIPVTSIARTLFDICGHERVSSPRKLRMLRHALQKGWVTPAGLRAIHAEMRTHGRDGVTFLHNFLETLDDEPPTESELEELVLAVLVRAGVPLPRRQVALGDADGFIGRVDFLYAVAGLIIEADGRGHATWEQQIADRQRVRRLVAAGYAVIQVTWRELIEDPSDFIASVRAILARAA
ncbi:MAG: hypothetical protein QOG03_1008 [Actinomycetota bacterium]|jgi:very-short-patch-repair endonuclease|nr:hypothetical protein [Actinomycetota bacterium]